MDLGVGKGYAKEMITKLEVQHIRDAAKLLLQSTHEFLHQNHHFRFWRRPY
jgi:hypothetical protein